MFTVPKTMQAVVYRGANDLRLETVPVPRIGPDELLVRVAVCGVCPTDIKKIQYGTVPPPRIFGHETAGTIVRAGARVRQFRARRARGAASSCAVPGVPCLPPPRLRPVRPIQAHRDHGGLRAGGRRLCRIRPGHALRPAGRGQNPGAQLLSRRRDARTGQHRPQSRQTARPVARRHRAGGRPGADRADVHPPARLAGNARAGHGSAGDKAGVGAGVRGGGGVLSEIRNPKTESRRKAEIRRPKAEVRASRNHAITPHASTPQPSNPSILNPSSTTHARPRPGRRGDRGAFGRRRARGPGTGPRRRPGAALLPHPARRSNVP